MVFVYFDIYKLIFVFKVEKANRLQRIYLVIYKLFVVVIIIIRICEFRVLLGIFCLIKCYILDLDTACENKSDQ